jgi:hypothetical protein
MFRIHHAQEIGSITVIVWIEYPNFWSLGRSYFKMLFFRNCKDEKYSPFFWFISIGVWDFKISRYELDELEQLEQWIGNYLKRTLPYFNRIIFLKCTCRDWGKQLQFFVAGVFSIYVRVDGINSTSCRMKTFLKSRIWGSHSSNYEYYHVLGYSAV